MQTPASYRSSPASSAWRCWCRALVLLVFGAGLALASQAQAQVTCNVTFTNVAFGSIDVLPGTQIDGSGTLTTSCTGLTGTSKVILCHRLDNGTYPLSGSDRQMGSGTNRLSFNIFQDLGRSIIWNSTGTGILGVVLTATVPSVVTPVYARVPGSQQSVPPAAYTTTITSSIYGSLYTGVNPACSTQNTLLGTRTFTVTATVVSSCTVTTTTLNFGTATLLTANIDSTSSVSVVCTQTTPYQVRLNGGVAAAVNPALRKMSLGANTISYGLYRDAARGLYWGATDGTDTQAGTGTSAATAHTVYGRIPPQASQPPGIYTDTVVVIVSFM